MNDSSIPSSDLVQLAYRPLKQDTDYDKMDLFLRANVAAYEPSGVPRAAGHVGHNR